MKSCGIETCGKPHFGNGLCQKHNRLGGIRVGTVNKLILMTTKFKSPNGSHGFSHHSNFLKVKEMVYDMLGGKICVRCGETDVRCLQLDHKHGGGYKEMQKFRHTEGLLYHYLKHPVFALLNLQVLCANCNWIKVYEEIENEITRLDKRGTQQREYKRSLRINLLKVLGSYCIRCRCTDTRYLQLDHVNGGGTKERESFGNNTRIYGYYLKHIDEAKKKLQVLCANCNWKKRYEKAEF